MCCSTATLACWAATLFCAALLIVCSPWGQHELVFCHRPANLVYALFSPCALGEPSRTTWHVPLGLLTCEGDIEAHLLKKNSGIGVWHYRPKASCDDRALWVLYLHGNAETRAWGPAARKLKHLSEQECVHAVSFDPRGFGESRGTPSETGVIEDAVAVLEWIVAREPQPRNVVLLGHSLGAAIAVGVAASLCTLRGQQSSGPVVTLILEAAFTSIPETVSVWVEALGLRWLGGKLRDRLDASAPRFASIERVQELHCIAALLSVHGGSDWVVGPSLGERLHAAARASLDGPSAFIAVPGASHEYALLTLLQVKDERLASFMRAASAQPHWFEQARARLENVSPVMAPARDEI